MDTHTHTLSLTVLKPSQHGDWSAGLSPNESSPSADTPSIITLPSVHVSMDSGRREHKNRHEGKSKRITSRHPRQGKLACFSCLTQFLLSLDDAGLTHRRSCTSARLKGKYVAIHRTPPNKKKTDAVLQLPAVLNSLSEFSIHRACTSERTVAGLCFVVLKHPAARFQNGFRREKVYVWRRFFLFSWSSVKPELGCALFFYKVYFSVWSSFTWLILVCTEWVWVSARLLAAHTPPPRDRRRFKLWSFTPNMSFCSIKRWKCCCTTFPRHS